MKPPKFFQDLFKVKKVDYETKHEMIVAKNSIELLNKVEEFVAKIPKNDILKITMGNTIANITYKIYPLQNLQENKTEQKKESQK